MLGRTSFPRRKVRDPSLRWTAFFRDFNPSSAETYNKFPYVDSSVGQRSESGTSPVTVYRLRRSAHYSFGTAETTSASRLIGSKDTEVEPLGALASRDKTRSPRKTEETMHKAEKWISDNAASNNPDGEMSTPSKNSPAQAFVAQPMSRSGKEHQPAARLIDTIRKAIDYLLYRRFYYKSYTRECKYSVDPGTSDIEPDCREATDEIELIPVSEYVTVGLYILIALIFITLLSVCTSSSRQAGQAGTGTAKPCGHPESSSKSAENMPCHPETII
ncbi:hypothetical protein MTO96_037159 [Rhipicephalus appendiculatus]